MWRKCCSFAVIPFLFTIPFWWLLFSAHILPPWDSTILLQIKRPSPVPLRDLVVNFENNFDTISGSIPEPVSFTLTRTWFPRVHSLISTSPLLPFSLPQLHLRPFVSLLLFVQVEMIYLISPVLAGFQFPSLPVRSHATWDILIWLAHLIRVVYNAWIYLKKISEFNKMKTA